MKKSRVSLRAFGMEEVERSLDWVNDDEVTKYTGTSSPISADEHRAYWEKELKNPRRKTFSIVTSEGRHIGNIGLLEIDWVARNAEVYVYVGDAQYRGKGYGTEAIQCLVEYAFGRLNLHKLFARVYAYNERGAKSFEKCGFTREGHLREHVFRNGEYHDVAVLGILRSEQRDSGQTR
ncbi:MAG: GNAT family N-acetyltransferase [Candidatus Eiseniibacteriota bacterium]|nr:MAG: GNAT family N-acetyltransferase [Candidatus Eisenbacteria bacterium]